MFFERLLSAELLALVLLVLLPRVMRWRARRR